MKTIGFLLVLCAGAIFGQTIADAQCPGGVCYPRRAVPAPVRYVPAPVRYVPAPVRYVPQFIYVPQTYRPTVRSCTTGRCP